MNQTILTTEEMTQVLTPPGLATRNRFAAMGEFEASAPMVRRILLPFNFSNHSVALLRAIAEVAEQTGAAIHLLHVCPEETNREDHPGQERRDHAWAETAEATLRYWARAVVAGRTPTYVTVRTGKVVDVIVARAVATRADLVIMTTSSSHGQPGQRSIAERVSRLAACPVLAIPGRVVEAFARTLDGLPASAWRTILMPVDFSAAAVQALQLAAAMAEKNEGRLLLAHAAGAESPAGMERRTTEGIQSRVADWVRRHLRTPAHWEVVNWPGELSLYSILAEVGRAEADLILLPTSGNQWVRRLRAGSITDGVLRQANVPVLTVSERCQPA